MASKDSIIQKASFNGSWSQTWSDSHNSKDETRYVYMCSPVWYIVASATYQWGIGEANQSGIFQIYISYWTGTDWSAETHYEISAKSASVTYRYGHNRDEGNLAASFHSHYPLWRVRYWPSRKNSRWSMTVYSGGWGVAGFNYPIDQKIRSRGRSGAAGIHSAGTSDAGSPNSGALASIFNYSLRTGSPILASNDDAELVHYPYLS
jgi:hypothetical protein